MGGIPGPSMLPTMLASEAAYRKNLPEPLSLDAYKPELLKELTDGKARELAVNDLKKLKESIDKLTETGKAREAAAKDLVADFVKTRGIKHGASTDFHGEYTIGEDTGLAPLKAVLDKEKDPHAMMRGSSAPVQFGTRFFWTVNANSGARESAVGNYKPEFYPERAAETAAFSPNRSEPVFLAWRTDEKQAAQVSFTAAKPRVIEAWKRGKARDLARAEAERLANEIRNKPGDSEFIIMQNMLDMEAQLKSRSDDAKCRDKVKAFRIENVAPFVIGMAQDMGRGPSQTVTPFQFTPTNDVPYPTFDMQKTLLEDRTKPVKTVFMQADRPKDSYYVFALLSRHVQSPEEFRAHVYGFGFGGNPVGQQIMNAQKHDAGRRADETILALLKKEFKYVETDDQKKRLDDREKKGGEE
jgi:hypothetical protein